MVGTSQPPRPLRSSLSSVALSEDDQVTRRKPLVSKRPAPLSPGFRLTTRRKPVVRKLGLPQFSLSNDPESESAKDDSTYCSESSDDRSELSMKRKQEESVEEPLNAADSLERTQARCRTSLPSATGVSVTVSGSERPIRLSSMSTSRLDSMTAQGAPHIDTDETLVKEAKKALPQVAMEARRKCGPAFAQLRFAEGEAHVDYVRLPVTQKGLDEISPAPTLTRSPTFVGLRNSVLNSTA